MSERTASEADRGDSRLSLGELTRAGGVSVRTVRYYIAEGLLPPPVGAGPGSYYTDAHLDRLRLIARLKASYLPLKEIRRRLAGLSDAEVRRLLAAERDRPAEPVDSAAAYLDRVLGSRPSPPTATPPRTVPGDSRLEVWGLPVGTPSLSDVGPEPPSPSLSARADDPPPPVPGYPTPTPVLGRAYPAAFGIGIDEEAAPAAEAGATQPDAWRRVPLGDDAELLIRDSAYTRRRDRVEWLIAWARKVFG